MLIPLHLTSPDLSGAKAPECPFARRREDRRRRREPAEPIPDVIAIYQAELEAEIAIYFKKCYPRDLMEEHVVEMAARSGLRWARLVEARDAIQALRVRAAALRVQEAKEDRVAALSGLLETEPDEAVRLLERSSDGCAWLADEWFRLRHGLRKFGSLTPAGARRLLQLLGHGDAPPAETDSPRLLAAHQAARLLVEAREVGVPFVAADPFADRPELRDALHLLLALADEQVEALDRRSDELHRRDDAPALAQAGKVAAFDPSPEARLLDRQIAEADRTRRRVLEELARLRRGAAEPRPYRRDPAPRVPASTFATTRPDGPIATTMPAAMTTPATPVPAATIATTVPVPPPASPTRNEPGAPEASTRNEPSAAPSSTRNEPSDPAASVPNVADVPKAPPAPEPPKLNRRQRRALKKRKP